MRRAATTPPGPPPPCGNRLFRPSAERSATAGGTVGEATSFVGAAVVFVAFVAPAVVTVPPAGAAREERAVDGPLRTTPGLSTMAAITAAATRTAAAGVIRAGSARR